MNTARAFAEKVICVRKKLQREGTSKASPVIIAMALKSVQPWLDAYPHATFQQVRGHIYRYREAFLMLIPGPKSTLHQSLMQEMQTILNSYPMNRERKWHTIEIGGQHFNFDVTTSDEMVTIHGVVPATDEKRDILHVMDREILQQIKQNFEHKYLTTSA